MDFLFSVLATVILGPFFLAIVVAIKLETPGPIFFRQNRIGIHKTYFNILKFRTMRIDTPYSDFKVVINKCNLKVSYGVEKIPDDIIKVGNKLIEQGSCTRAIYKKFAKASLGKKNYDRVDTLLIENPNK